MFLPTDPAYNLVLPVSSATAALGGASHQTDGQRVPGGGVCVGLQHHVLHVLRPVLPAYLPGFGLVPPGEHDAVPLNICPANRTFSSRGRAGTQTGEISRVRVSPGQTQQDQQEE